MILTIDAGNSFVKTAVFEGITLIQKNVYAHDIFGVELQKLLFLFSNIQNIIISDVGSGKIKELIQGLDSQNVTIISRETSLPFKNNYGTPHTLGIDRMVLAAGAVLRFPNMDRLVIDAGTCVTYDYVTCTDTYLGGAISPGLRLRYQSLHQHTAQLPLLERAYPQDNIGCSTAESMHSGVVQGLTYEIEGFINNFTINSNNFIIILTGGDAFFLAKRLKNTIFANSNFLLESLNLIHIYNAKK